MPWGGLLPFMSKEPALFLGDGRIGQFILPAVSLEDAPAIQC